MSERIEPKGIVIDEEYSGDGTRKRRISVDTGDIALVLVTGLLLIFFIMALAVPDLRDELSGVVKALIGVMTLAVGGLAAFKVFRGKNA